MRRLPLLIVFVLVLVAACDRGEDSPGTTAAPTATTVAPTTAATSGTVATTTAAAEDDTTEEPDEEEIVAGMPTYEVVERIDSDVEVLAEVDGDPVLCRYGAVTVASFHPELSGDARLHQRWLETAGLVPAA